MAAKRKIRYALIGPGHIAQVAVLPAFAHARANSELAALVSSDRAKLSKLARKYGVEAVASYDQLEDCIAEHRIDAVYVALPNHMHAEYAVRAARAGAHVLCEKPMAVTGEECLAMIQAAEDANVRLMIAYRLHFQKTHLKAIDIARTKRLGDLRTIHGDLTLVVRDADNIRLNPRSMGGGPLYDLGIYCINAARYVFRDEPESVFAYTARSDVLRFDDVEETLCGILKFPRERLCTFQCSVGAAPLTDLRVLGTKGDLHIESAFDYAKGMTQYLTVSEKTKVKRFPKQDQFAPELLYFSECILKNREPEPSGLEGLLDVRIIQALHASADAGEPVELLPFDRSRRPDKSQEISRPPVRKPEVFHATSPHGD
jgi:glucose-fructose oxidoreductase